MSKRAPNSIDKHVGSRVRMRRLMLGMSQEQLGEALGLTFQQVQKYEKGTNRVGASRIQEISEILQVPVSFLFEVSSTGISKAEGLAEVPFPDYVSDFVATSHGLTLIRAFTRITDPKLRRSIVDLVEQIASREAPDPIGS
jgi:transcriptional regulator with XRE-family HTH domain